MNCSLQIFSMDLNKYRNCINNLINWEWNTLKQLRRKRRRNFLLRISFVIFSLVSILFCIFSPAFIIWRLLISIGVQDSLADLIRIIILFSWLWFISPMDNASKKEREEKNKRKIEIVEKVEKIRKAYDKKYK